MLDQCDPRMKQLSSSIRQLSQKHDKESLQQLMHMIEFRTKDISDSFAKSIVVKSVTPSKPTTTPLHNKIFLPDISSTTTKIQYVRTLEAESLKQNKDKRIRTLLKSGSVADLVLASKTESSYSKQPQSSKHMLDLRMQRSELIQMIFDKLNLNQSQTKSIMSTIKNQSSILTQPSVDSSIVNATSIAHEYSEASTLQDISKSGVNEASNNTLVNNSINQSKILRQKLRRGKLSEARILPKEMRENPFATIPVVRQKDLSLGLLRLVNQGLIPKNTDILPAFISAGANAIITSKKQLCPFEAKRLMPVVETKPTYKLDESVQTERQPPVFFTDVPDQSMISVIHETSSAIIPTKPFAADQSVSIDYSHDQGQLHFGDLSSVQINHSMIEHHSGGLFPRKPRVVEIIQGFIEESENYYEFRNEFSEDWGSIYTNLVRLEKKCRELKVNILRIDLNRLAELSGDLIQVQKQQLLSCVLNAEPIKKMLVEKTKKKQLLSAAAKIKMFYRIIQAKNKLEILKSYKKINVSTIQNNMNNNNNRPLDSVPTHDNDSIVIVPEVIEERSQESAIGEATDEAESFKSQKQEDSLAEDQIDEEQTVVE